MAFVQKTHARKSSGAHPRVDLRFGGEESSKTVSALVSKQFAKTRLCRFYELGKCERGSSCGFAHGHHELLVTPNLAKTKLCFNFFRNRCAVDNCKFAHGYEELKGTSSLYKTEMCRWMRAGACKAGRSCRYAHSLVELRASAEVVNGHEDRAAPAAMSVQGDIGSASRWLGPDTQGQLQSLIRAPKPQLPAPYKAPIALDAIDEARHSDGRTLEVRATFVDVRDGDDDAMAVFVRGLRRTKSAGDLPAMQSEYPFRSGRPLGDEVRSDSSTLDSGTESLCGSSSDDGSSIENALEL